MEPLHAAWHGKQPAILAVAHLALAAAGGVLALLAGYLLFLTGAALLRRRPAVPPGRATHRFAILIPAHDEEQLIGRLLDNLRELDYPSDGCVVYVVADHCTDRTASIARARGAVVFERTASTDRGKGFALRWLLHRIHDTGAAFDAYVVLDADSVVAGNFLRCMDARLQAGSQAIQAYYAVLNPAESPLAGLRYAALAAVHYLRPLGRASLGWSCGLKGNGMCFAAPVLERFAWRWFTLAEDVEFHLALVREGVRVDFAPETSVLAEMPLTYAQAASQNARWERGRLQLLRDQVPSLIAAGVRQRSAMRLDAAIEQFIPPLSVPFALSGLCLVVSWLTGATPAVLVAGFSLAAQAAYLLASLAVVRAPARVYRALAYAPLYILWKVGVYAQALAGGRTSEWVRTARLSPAAQQHLNAHATAR